MYSLLHKAKGQILYSLRHVSSATYTELRLPTHLQSEDFKFYIRALTKEGLIAKLSTGHYSLTAKGKEFANNLDEKQRHIQKQPKLSLIVIASRKKTPGRNEYLLQQRLRMPFWGYWGLLSGPVQWGETLEDAAKRELFKQTGLTGIASVSTFYRKRDYDKATGDLLEDKLFAIVTITSIRGNLSNTWRSGHNEWIGLDKLDELDHYFPSTRKMIEAARQGIPFYADDTKYSLEDY